MKWLKRKLNQIIDIITHARDAELPPTPSNRCPQCHTESSWLNLSKMYVCRNGHRWKP